MEAEGGSGSCSLEGWKAAQELGELEPQQLRTKFILNHTPRSSQLIAELETIRELPNYCQLERANQAPAPTPRPALTTKCQTSLEADALPPCLCLPQTQQRGLTKASAGHQPGARGKGPDVDGWAETNGQAPPHRWACSGGHALRLGLGRPLGLIREDSKCAPGQAEGGREQARLWGHCPLPALPGAGDTLGYRPVFTPSLATRG